MSNAAEAYATAEKIADWFLARNRTEESEGGEPITNLKLQKLLYYAQGIVLAVTDRKLFDDKIEAWIHGPVVPVIYRKYKCFKDGGIAFEGTSDSVDLPDDITKLLEYVYKEFGQFSAWRLRDMTHNEAPWQSTKINGVISTDLIKEYFEHNYLEEE